MKVYTLPWGARLTMAIGNGLCGLCKMCGRKPSATSGPAAGFVCCIPASRGVWNVKCQHAPTLLTLTEMIGHGRWCSIFFLCCCELRINMSHLLSTRLFMIWHMLPSNRIRVLGLKLLGVLCQTIRDRPVTLYGDSMN